MFTHQTLRCIEAAAGPMWQSDTLDRYNRGNIMREAFRAAREGDFVNTQFADTLLSLTANFSEGFIDFEHIRTVEVQAFVARAQDWLDIELAKRKRLTVYKVETPLGTFSVMAKSFTGARFAAGEKIFNNPGRRLPFEARKRFAANIKSMPVWLCVHAFHYITEAEANKNVPRLPALEQSLVDMCDDFLLRHWLGLAS